LAVIGAVNKNLAEFECQGQRSKVKVTGTKKNEKLRHFVQGSVLVRHFFSGAVIGCASTPVGKSAHVV